MSSMIPIVWVRKEPYLGRGGNLEHQAPMRVALGKATADLAIVNGSVVNVYTGEVVHGDTVLIKGEKIAYVGRDAGGAIGPSTRILDAAGKLLIPGFIDGHSHMLYPFSACELARFAMKHGTTTIITETGEIAFPLGYRGITEYLRSIRRQPIKIFAVAPPMVTLSAAARQHALTVKELRNLLRRKEVVGLGEPYWSQVVAGDPRCLDLIAETIKAGKRVDGHSAGAKGNKLQAYIASGISSCHEPVTAEEVKERLRAGLYVFIREGEIRRELEAVARLREEKIDFRHLALSTDGLGPREMINDGYMDFVVQKAIDLGFDPIRAIQMATLNPAQRYGMEGRIGGIAPGKEADILMIPGIKTIRPDYVISRGRVVAKDGQPVLSPRPHAYPASVYDSIRLSRCFNGDDFSIPVESLRKTVKVRVIEQVTELVTREAVLDMAPAKGHLEPESGRDIVKVATIEKTYTGGKTFAGLIKGTGFQRGAIASSAAWDASNITVIGCSGNDMAHAVNRVKDLGGGVAVCAGNRVLAEIAFPVGGWISLEPMESIATQLNGIQRAAADLGCRSAHILLTVDVLTTPAIPFLRITEDGLVDVRENRAVPLIEA